MTQLLQSINWAIIEPVLEPGMMRSLCVFPYPNHPHGCPNLGKKSTCPPKYPLLQDLIKLDEVWAIWNVFPIGEHIRKMRGKHPCWTKRQVRNVLYWQGTARKQLKAKVKLFLEEHRGLFVVHSPEAAGVNLTKTMKQIGIQLEWPPEIWAYQIVLAGEKK